MDLFETSTESFVVRIWTSAAATAPAEDTDPDWHGQVIHVLSGEVQTFASLEELEAFMRPYLQELGMAADSAWFKRHHPF
jgi:hypothetical protein